MVREWTGRLINIGPGDGGVSLTRSPQVALASLVPGFELRQSPRKGQWVVSWGLVTTPANAIWGLETRVSLAAWHWGFKGLTAPTCGSGTPSYYGTMAHSPGRDGALSRGKLDIYIQRQRFPTLRSK